MEKDLQFHVWFREHHHQLSLGIWMADRLPRTAEISLSRYAFLYRFIKLQYSNFQADNTLIVRKADKSYSGVYTCQATNSAGDNEQKTTIRIMNTPMISPGQSSFNMVVDDLFTIPCDVYGDPKPVITWLLDDKPFTEGVVNEDGSLTIPNVNEAHRGTFTCHAQNAAGNDTRTVTLTVHTTPTINAEVG